MLTIINIRGRLLQKGMMSTELAIRNITHAITDSLLTFFIRTPVRIMIIVAKKKT